MLIRLKPLLQALSITFCRDAADFCKSCSEVIQHIEEVIILKCYLAKDRLVVTMTTIASSLITKEIGGRVQVPEQHMHPLTHIFRKLSIISMQIADISSKTEKKNPQKVDFYFSSDFAC